MIGAPMGSKRTQQRQAELRRSTLAALGRELGAGLLAIPSLVLGLLLIAIFFQTAAEYAVGVWQAIIAFAVALAATVIGLMLVGWVAALVLGPAAVGWVAMFSGQLPQEFAPGQRNGGRALANLMLAAICLPLGVLLFRHGVREGELNWAIEGLFLAGSGVILGLLPAIPRLYFSRWRPEAEPEPVEGEAVIAFIVAASLGVGLSLAVCFGFEGRQRGEQQMRPGVWHTGCVTNYGDSCPPGATYVLLSKTRREHYIDLRGGCASVTFRPGDDRPVQEVEWVDLHRRGIETYNREREIRTRVVRLRAGQRILLEVKPPDEKRICSFKVRYRPAEATR